MKYLYSYLLALAFTLSATAQTTIPIHKYESFIATPQDSAAAIVFKILGCPSSHHYYKFEDSVVPIYDEITCTAWTYNSGGCSDGYVRSLQTFPQLATLPSNITIDSARLKLTGKTLPFISNTYGNSYHTGSPYFSSGSNEVEVQRILQNWSVKTTTWNNQPATTPTNMVVIPASTSKDQYHVTLDVTGMIQDMVDSSQPYGFLFKTQVEAYYRSMVFYSSNTTAGSETVNKRPELEIYYHYDSTISTSIANTSVNALSLKLYPNPARDRIVLGIQSLKSFNLKCNVINYNGQVLKQESYQVDKGYNTIPISVEELPSGTYMLSINDGINTQYKRFTKL
ncbi:MAG: DNRLRE domain-containing protein [Flavipsychrobacter sp.]